MQPANALHVAQVLHDCDLRECCHLHDQRALLCIVCLVTHDVSQVSMPIDSDVRMMLLLLQDVLHVMLRVMLLGM